MIRRLLLSLSLIALVQSTAFATWSVIAIDIRTGQVIIASATCVLQAGFPNRVPNGARDLMDVQAVIVPGFGVAACQAGVDNTRQNQMLVYNELKKGTPPAQILEMLKADPSIQRRQFGILTFPVNGLNATTNKIGWNGSGNSTASLFEGGQVGDFHFQVQGNTLANDEVVHAAARAFKEKSGSLADRVMAAMEAADANGGDKRCTCANNPLPTLPCDARTAHVAYIAIADKADAAGVTHNDGKYFAFISVGETNTQPGESANPVKTLRLRYDAWVKAGAQRMAPPGPTLYKPGG